MDCESIMKSQLVKPPKDRSFLWTMENLCCFPPLFLRIRFIGIEVLVGPQVLVSCRKRASPLQPMLRAMKRIPESLLEKEAREVFSVRRASSRLGSCRFLVKNGC